MRVELLGAINYDKLASYMDKRVEQLVSDNNSILESVTKLKDKNLCTPENIGLIDDIIFYLTNNANGDITESYIKDLKRIKESFYKNREDIEAAIKLFRKNIKSNNEDLYRLRKETIETIKQLEKERRTALVAAAGNLSHFSGKVFEMLEEIESRALEKNAKLVDNICKLGHNSIEDHDYVVFLVEDVSLMLEQILIEERFASFTIKSRREVNHADAGTYIPDFHDEYGNVIPNNDAVRQEFISFVNWLFDKYSFFINNGIAKEDARFVLPYNTNSNFFMGMDAHVVKDVIIKLLKTKLSLIQEAKELGERLYEIAKEHFSYIIPEIDRTPVNLNDDVLDYIEKHIGHQNYKILDKPKLISSSTDVDDTILITAIMRKTQLSYEQSKMMYEESIRKNPNFKEELMELIFKNGDRNELAQVGFEFQIPISYAVLTHYTRHRTHPITVPPFASGLDLYQYKIPPAIKEDEGVEGGLCDKFNDIYTMNKLLYDKFKYDYGIREEDLVYFTLSGHMVNIVTRLDGKTFAHIAALRKCERAQWESRDIAHGLHDEVKEIKGAELFSRNLGPLCETHGICKEGKKSCGKVIELRKQKEQAKESK